LYITCGDIGVLPCCCLVEEQLCSCCAAEVWELLTRAVTSATYMCSGYQRHKILCSYHVPHQSSLYSAAQSSVIGRGDSQEQQLGPWVTGDARYGSRHNDMIRMSCSTKTNLTAAVLSQDVVVAGPCCGCWCPAYADKRSRFLKSALFQDRLVAVIASSILVLGTEPGTEH